MQEILSKTALNRVRARQKGVRGYVNCMRPSCLSNPYRIGVDGDRSECCELFRQNLPRLVQSNPKMEAKITDIREQLATGAAVALGCSCSLDQECHVDSLIEFILN